jgi:hypothetical protein
MELTDEIKKDLELLNDPNLSEHDRDLLNILKMAVSGESKLIPHEEVKKMVREMLDKNHSDAKNRKLE